ncbi:MAG TPA: hypothetical protein VH165_26180, partial [Kofleriaceae bacterium]|nr:hypothetical protein [Kofleriaceae bacterium]
MTARYKLAVLRRPRFVITVMGEAMAPASESRPSGRIRSGAGAAPVYISCTTALLVLACVLGAGCGDDAQPRPRPVETPAPDRAVADPARGVTTELDGAAPVYVSCTTALLVLACVLGAGCGDDAQPRPRLVETPAPDRAVADPARGV